MSYAHLNGCIVVGPGIFLMSCSHWSTDVIQWCMEHSIYSCKQHSYNGGVLVLSKAPIEMQRAALSNRHLFQSCALFHHSDSSAILIIIDAEGIYIQVSKIPVL